MPFSAQRAQFKLGDGKKNCEIVDFSALFFFLESSSFGCEFIAFAIAGSAPSLRGWTVRTAVRSSVGPTVRASMRTVRWSHVRSAVRRTTRRRSLHTSPHLVVKHRRRLHRPVEVVVERLVILQSIGSEGSSVTIIS